MPRVYVMPTGDVRVIAVGDPDVVARKAGIAHVPFIETNEVPVSRRFRAAWRVNGGTVTVDMPAARALRMAEIRQERDRRLQASDGPMFRAQDQGDAARIAALRTYRQALRDIPQTTDLMTATSPEALDALGPVWPA